MPNQGGSQQVGDGVPATGGVQAAPIRVHSSMGLPSIDPLKGRENWPTWKFAVQTFLELEDLWEAVKPTPNADGTDPVVDPLMNRRARGKIILLLHPEIYVHVQEAKTAKDVWAKLEAAYEDTGLTRKVGLLRKLITSSLATDGSMETYVNTIIATAHQLRGIGFDISDEWIGTLLLAGLPEEYRPMIMALENSGTAITGDIVKTKLLQELRVPPSSSSAGAAFSSNKHYGRKSKPSDPAPQGKGPKCRRCQKFGHIARECPQKESKKGNAWCTVLSTIAEDDSNWYFDSGASNHFTKTETLLEDVRRHGGTVVAANRGAMKVVAKGSMKLTPKCCPEDAPIEVNDVHVIPELSTNLLSVNQIVQRGHTVTFTSGGVKVINPEGKVIATGSRTNGLFKLDQLQPTTALACSSAASVELWHRRMGHINFNSLQRMKGGLVSGIDFSDAVKKDENCRICAMGKLTRLPFSKIGSRATELLELVHSDICGPMEVESLGGSRYYLTFIDDKSRRIASYFLAEKSAESVFKAFEDFRCVAERQTGKKLKVLRTDNGKEFCNKLLGDHLKRLGVRHQTTVDYTPEQNGLAERVNRTIVERARCMLFDARLPKSFWAEAAATAVYLVNRSPTKGHGKTPEEVWTGKKPSLAHVRVFGTPVMAHVPKQKRKKWDAKAHECILTGFDEDTKAYRLWDPKARQIIKRRDVSFINEGGAVEPPNEVKATAAPKVRLEDVMSWEPTSYEAPTVQGGIEQDEAEAVPVEEDDSGSEDEGAVGPISDDNVTTVTPSALPSRTSSNPPESPALRRSGRERFLTGKLKDFFFPNIGLPSNRFTDDANDDTATAAAGGDPGAGANRSQQGLVVTNRPKATGDPRTPSEALNGQHGDLWSAAMDDEYQSHIDNGTWELVELPPNRKAIGCKWLFKAKEDAKGNVVRHKARLVAQGFTQKFGVDFDEVFAPVCKQVTLRTLLTIASRRRMSVKHVDVKTAYLHGNLEEVIYMKQPERYATKDPNVVCLLKKSIYGLKQSARVWNQRIDEVFRSMGFKPSKADPCLYVRRRGNKTTFILLYVDDMLIVTETDEEFAAIYRELQKNFDVANLGDVKHFLGMEVERDSSGFKLNQRSYILKLAERHGVKDAKPSKIPLDPAYLQQKEEEENKLPSNKQYLGLIGGLLYVAVHSRPDIAVSTSILAQKSSCPTQLDWQEAKRVLRYLKATSDHKLHLGSANTGLELFADADWAGNHRDRKSNTGFLIRFGGGVISWASRKQSCVALSSTEAEFVALAEACQELTWVKKLLADFGEDVSKPVPTFEDNQSCIKLVSSDRIEKRSKHIETKYFYVRDLQEKNQIRLEYCPTENMLADILTKPLQQCKIRLLREQLGLLPNKIEEEC